jgi:phosphatidylglycerophosphate synthase
MSEQVKIREHIKVAPTENLIIWMIYIAAIPIARIALYLKMSPNYLTTLSSGFALCSGTALLIKGLHDAFIPLFIISLLLDFADGLVARTTGKIGRTAFRFDHISDLFKLPFVVLCLAIFCDSTFVWIFAMCSTTLFLISTVLNHDLSFAIKKETLKSKLDSHKIEEPKNAIITNIFTIFFTYNSHTLLLYIVIAAKPQFAVHIFTYLIIISSYACMRYINALMKLEH